jgi:hypothetical protein
MIGMEGGHLVNANRLVQTLIDIDLKVCNAIQLVKRCPPTTNKKHPQLCTEGKSLWNLNFFTDNNVGCEQRKIFQPWAKTHAPFNCSHNLAKNGR